MGFLIAGYVLMLFSFFEGFIKGDRQWGFNFYLVGLLNWIIYYLSVGKA